MAVVIHASQMSDRTQFVLSFSISGVERLNRNYKKRNFQNDGKMRPVLVNSVV